MSKYMSNQKNQSEKMKKERFYVRGMHCASCEVLIEKTLIEKEGVRKVEASLAGGVLDIHYVKGTEMSPDMLNGIFKDLGYTFSRNRERGGSHQKKVSPFMYPAIFLVILALFFLFDEMQLGQFMSVDATSSLIAFFLFGLAAGMSSCAALVGGVVLSMTKKWNEQYITAPPIKKMRPHVGFHAGRIIAYVFLGGILGAVGSAITFDNIVIYALLIILISIVMIILGLQMLDVSWVRNVRIGTPKFLSRFASGEKGRQRGPFLLGSATFFLPCGFTLIAQGIALVSGSFLAGALIMGMFALGTLPILLAISVSGVYLNSKPHLTARFNVVAGILVLFFGLYNINAQMNVLGLPSVGAKASVEEQWPQVAKDTKLAEENQLGEDQTEQALHILAQGFEYIPETTPTLKAGVPTTLVVDNQGIQGCGRYMAARGLFPGWIELKPGENTLEFTPKKGTYKLTCTMGMVPPVIIKVE